MCRPLISTPFRSESTVSTLLASVALPSAWPVSSARWRVSCESCCASCGLHPYANETSVRAARPPTTPFFALISLLMGMQAPGPHERRGFRPPGTLRAIPVLNYVAGSGAFHLRPPQKQTRAVRREGENGRHTEIAPAGDACAAGGFPAKDGSTLETARTVISADKKEIVHAIER